MENIGFRVILPGTCQKFRTLPEGTKDFPQMFLQADAMVAHRTPTTMTLERFNQWAVRFTEETEELRLRYQYSIMKMDGFSGHISTKTLTLLMGNNIIALDLPQLTSSRLQVLEYGS